MIKVNYKNKKSIGNFDFDKKLDEVFRDGGIYKE